MENVLFYEEYIKFKKAVSPEERADRAKFISIIFLENKARLELNISRKVKQPIVYITFLFISSLIR